jgi:Flp pilus assembly protein CpaB
VEASTSSKRGGGRSFRDLTSTRQGSLLVALGAALLAGLLLLLFVQRYRDDQNAKGTVKSVFVARALIPRGSAADVVAASQLFQRTDIKGGQIKTGAITDPSVIRGQVATRDIYPGSQITASDFQASSDQVIPKLRGTDRAIEIPVDNSHGLVGQLHDGDRVDVLAGFGGTGGAASRATVRTLVDDVVVLKAPAGSGGGVNSNGGNNATAVLKVSDRDAARLAYASDNGKVWLVLRPAVGARNSSPITVIEQNVTAGN